MQTVRIATQPLHLFLGPPGCPSLVKRSVEFEQTARSHGITMMALGATSRQEDLSVLPRIVAKTQGLSVTFDVPEECSDALALAAAQAMLQVAAETGG